MFSGLRYWLSPVRRRFMRSLGRPAIARIDARLRRAATPAAAEFVTILLGANTEFLAYAISPDAPLGQFGNDASVDRIEACLISMLIYSAAQFAREEILRDGSELIPMLATATGADAKQVMLRRDHLRKAPRSEEWLLFTWLVADLGGERPQYDPQLERAFGYQYLSYIGQYRPALERSLAKLS
jgi:hypothetical protein